MNFIGVKTAKYPFEKHTKLLQNCSQIGQYANLRGKIEITKHYRRFLGFELQSKLESKPVDP